MLRKQASVRLWLSLQKEEAAHVADLPKLRCKNCGKEVSEAVLVRTKAASGVVIRREILCKSCYRKIKRAGYLLAFLILAYCGGFFYISIFTEFSKFAEANPEIWTAILMAGVFILLIIYQLMKRP